MSRRIRKSSILPEKNLPDETILFFSPEAGVTPIYVAQCVVARTLKEAGHRVLFSRCFEVFERCPVMDMYQLPYTDGAEIKAAICLKCAGASFDMLDEYGLESFDLRKFLTRDVTSKYQQALLKLTDDLRQFEYDSVPFGRLSMLDLVLATKISNFEKVSEEIRLAWLKYIKSSLLSYLLIDHVCEKFSISRIVHHNDYSIMLGPHMAARKHGIPSFTVAFAAHNAVDLRRSSRVADLVWNKFDQHEQAWPALRDLPLSESKLKDVAHDLLVRVGAKRAHT